MAYLLVHRGEGEAARPTFDGPCLQAGRSAENDICLSGDATVSRQHAQFTREGDRYFVRDASSRSGSRVNGERAAGIVELRRGDRVTIGRTVIHFLFEGDKEPEPAGGTAATGASPGTAS